MASCPHLSSGVLTLPRPTDPVYREDCTICFDSAEDADGLDVCLHCFNGGCASERAHGRLHAEQFQHPLAVNIQRSRKRKQRDDGEPPEKMSKLEIKAETDADRFDTKTDVRCFECGLDGLAGEGTLDRLVEGVLQANTFAQNEEVKAWQLELTACEHSLCLEQEAKREIPSGDLGQCTGCELKENLWLCLTCGNLGCGRKQMGGLPGNSHARQHGDCSHHPVAVKLGSITAEGNADVYCYHCEEERIDPELVTHLANWGIDLAGRVKTEKSLGELQLEHNLSHDFSMTTEDGTQMKPMFGPGLTGLKNLGNSCYLASVLQSLFAIPEFADRYYRPNERIPPLAKPADDLEVQLRKLADGLLSGRYSKPDDGVASRESSHEKAYQSGLAPAMLKHLVGRGHAEFSTSRQQDSFELLNHLMKLISRSQQSSQSQYKDISDPVQAFRFVVEQKLQCLQCKRVRYRQDEMENISVAVPIQRLPRTGSNPGVSHGTDGKDSENQREQFQPVTIQQCLDDYTAVEVVDLTCSSCGNRTFTKQTLFKSFPTVLAVNARRFEIVNWVPTKQDVPVIVGDGSLDMEAYRSQGKQSDEEELPEESTASTDAKFVPNDAALVMLMAMGFPKVRCEKALHATGNTDVETAMAWLFEHMEDADIDAPLEAGNVGSAGPADPEKIEALGNMGFGAPQARQALKATAGDLERAVDWLFSHPDATGDFDDDGTSVPATNSSEVVAKAEVQDNKPGRFSLASIVCHKGSSIHAGHYVAFVRKKEGWVLFNDEKVALGGDVEEMTKFAYIYFFRRQA